MSDLHTLIKESYRLHSGCISELPEIDQFFKPTHAEVLKNLITQHVDEISRPYELPSKAKRWFSFIGTSNVHQLVVRAQATAASSLSVSPIPTKSLGVCCVRSGVACRKQWFSCTGRARSWNTSVVN